MEPDNNTEAYAWLAAYQAALSESEEKLLPGAVSLAQESIIKRRVTLHRDTADDREIQALEIALKTLRVIHNNRL